MSHAVSSRSAFGPLLRRTQQRATALLLMLSMLLALGLQDAQAAPKAKPSSINAVPTVTKLEVVNGQLVADGFITATIKGQTTRALFNDVPVNLSLAEDQTGAHAGCPILDLELGAITLDLLGLVVETSDICLKITAIPGGGLLGDLLCGVANLLQGGLTLDQILNGQGTATLPGLSNTQLASLNTGLVDLLNGALAQLNNAVLTAIQMIDRRNTCAILNLELGPLNLTLLGLNVVLDDCEGGPVTVDITAVTGRGKLLGNLLCGLLGGGLINLGTTLQGVLAQILGQLAL